MVILLSHALRYRIIAVTKMNQLLTLLLQCLIHHQSRLNQCTNRQRPGQCFLI